MNENEVNANLYLSINEYTNCNISLQELKSRIMNAFENNKKLFCDNNLGCIFILIDSYSDRFTYRGTNKLIYIIKKISHAAGIGEDPITEEELRNRLAQLARK